MSKLFDDSDSGSDVDLKTNNKYAGAYNNWRQKEELNKLKTKYGEVASKDDETGSSSSDDDDGQEEVPQELEREFFSTLSNLKKKDPKIYDENFEFFTEPVHKQPKASQREGAPIYIKDYERNMLLENKAETGEEKSSPKESCTYIEEQNYLKQNLKDALKNVRENDDGVEWGGLFRARQKSKTEHEREQEEYKTWLAGRKEKIGDKDTEADLTPLKEYWCDPNLGAGDKFLRDYILDKRFLEDEDEDRVPTYEEIIHDSDAGLSEDETAIETQEEFEHKYNYRFEEPDEEFIKRYPRSMENSVRVRDDRRRIKRVETKERKEEEKRHKIEEIKQMRDLKRKEIEEKIAKLKEITGNNDVRFSSEDIEEDFDPDAHDKRMRKLFDDEFYEGVEGEQKPEFPELDDELELENWDGDKVHCEDEDFNMDCDYDPAAGIDRTRSDTTKERRNKRRRSKFAAAIGRTKPVFDPTDKTYQQYLDEYYALDCEDVISDVPCRFKYRQVLPNDFGLSVEEILLAKDKELNKWCSIKKAVQYRSQNVEKYDVIAFARKGQNEMLKRKILPSVYKTEEEGGNQSTAAENSEEPTGPAKPDRRKRKHLDGKEGDLVGNSNSDEKVAPSKRKSNDKKNRKRKTRSSNSDAGNTKPKQSKSQNRKIKFKVQENNSVKISDARLTAYGLKPKKFKNKLKYGQKT